MATQPYPALTITSLRAGLNDNDPPMALSQDACVKAENIEFFQSTLGERRMGCESISDLPTSITSDSNIQAVTWFGVHYPSNNLGDTELWTLAQHLTNSNYVLTRRTASAWSTVSPTDALTVTSGFGHKLSGVSLHGKFFLAHKSAVDFLHVWDGTALRRTGLTAPNNAPTAANTGSGTFSGTRFYRVRETVLSGSTVLLRSEPSPVLTFSPSGTGSGLIVTKPATKNSNTTHWEIEASTDNENFYRVSRIVVATTTYTDSVVYATGYANSGGSLSEDGTAYTQIPSGKYLSADSDRLIIGGSWETDLYKSRIWWTPTFGEEGNGNDERLDMTVNPYIDLDGFSGGELTGLSRPVNGYLFAFKWSRIYKIVRTGNRQSAYSAVPLTTARGALPGSLVEAVDEAGNPCQYFLDPTIGPMRIGQNGLEWCGRDLRNTWARVNLQATVPSHGLFYQAKNQVHFWVAVDGSDYPNFKLVVQCNEMQSGPDGARRGWSTVPVGDRISSAHCSIAFSSNLDQNAARNQSLVPFIGKEQWTVNGSTIKNLIQRCDTGTTDAYTSGDTDAYYWASVKTKPFLPTGPLVYNGLMAGTLIAAAISSPNNDIYVQAEKDFGAETFLTHTDLQPKKTETVVSKRLDNLNFSEMTAVQFELGDLDENVIPATSWQLHAFSAKIRTEQSS